MSAISKIKKVHLYLDEFLTSREDRKEIIRLFEDAKFETNVEVSDLSAKGGISWFPHDLIIKVTEWTAAGFFGAMGKVAFDRLKDKLKSLFENKISSLGSVYFVFEVREIVLYFEIDQRTYYSMDKDRKSTRLNSSHSQI